MDEVYYEYGYNVRHLYYTNKPPIIVILVK